MTVNVMFYHLPATGGRGINAWLEKRLRRADRGGACLNLRKMERKDGLKRAGLGGPYRAITGHFASPYVARAAGWKEWVAFTLLREPAVRLYSQYRHLCRASPILINAVYVGGRALSFEEWIQEPVCQCLPCLVKRRPHGQNPAVKFYASRIGEESLDAALEVLRRTRVYDLQDTARMISDMASCLGLDSDRGYKRIDTTGSGEKVSPEQRALVRRFHPLDYRLFEEAPRARPLAKSK